MAGASGLVALCRGGISTPCASKTRFVPLAGTAKNLAHFRPLSRGPRLLRADLVFARSLSRRQNFRSTPALVGSVSKNNRIAAAGEGAEGLNATPRARAGHPHAARLQFNWPLRLSICRPSSTNTPAA